MSWLRCPAHKRRIPWQRPEVRRRELQRVSHWVWQPYRVRDMNRLLNTEGPCTWNHSSPPISSKAFKLLCQLVIFNNRNKYIYTNYRSFLPATMRAAERCTLMFICLYVYTITLLSSVVFTWHKQENLLSGHSFLTAVLVKVLTLRRKCWGQE